MKKSLVALFDIRGSRYSRKTYLFVYLLVVDAGVCGRLW